MEFARAFNRFLLYDFRRVPAGPNGTFYDSAVRFGTRIESLASSAFAAANRLVADLNDLNLVGKRAPWRYLGRDYRSARNFPVIDLVVREGGATLFASVTHGTPTSLVHKFKELMRLSGSHASRVKHDRMVEALQYQARQGAAGIAAGAPHPIGSDAFIAAGRAEFLRRARLLVPEDSVEGLRAALCSNHEFQVWMAELGMTADELLQVVQKLPGVPPPV